MKAPRYPQAGIRVSGKILDGFQYDGKGRGNLSNEIVYQSSLSNMTSGWTLKKNRKRAIKDYTEINVEALQNYFK